MIKIHVAQTARMMVGFIHEALADDEPIVTASEAEFYNALAPYRKTQLKLQKLGFLHLVDYKQRRKIPSNHEYFMVRSMASKDGTTGLDFFQRRWRTAAAFQYFLIYVLSFQIGPAIRYLLKPLQNEKIFVLNTEFADGSFVQTTNGESQSYLPRCDTITVERLPYGTPVKQLIARHEARINDHLAKAQQPRLMTTAGARFAMEKRLHQVFFSNATRADWVRDSNPASLDISQQDAQMLFSQINQLFKGQSNGERKEDRLANDAAMPQQQDKTTPEQGNFFSWKARLALAMASAVLLFGVAAAVFSKSVGAILLFVIAFHEMGHYLAMKIFGYKNIIVIFFPYVAGRTIGEKEDAGYWQNIVMYLAGPTPGIILGLIAYAAAASGVFQATWLSDFAMISTAINLVNFLPIAPLDGGCIMGILLSDKSFITRLAAFILPLVSIVGVSWLCHNLALPILFVLISLELRQHFRVDKLVAAYRRRFGRERVGSNVLRNRLLEMQSEPDFPKWVSSHLNRATASAIQILRVSPPNEEARIAGLFAYVFCSVILPIACAAIIASHTAGTQ